MNNRIEAQSPAKPQPASEKEKNSSTQANAAPKPVTQWVQPDTLKRIISTVQTL